MNDIFIELARSNYWSGEVVNKGIARNQYINCIAGYIGNKLIKVLTGQRGSGKSYLLKQLVHRLSNEGVSSRNILYINRSFTDTNLLASHTDLRNIIELYQDNIRPVGKVYVFIEEVQEIAEWYELVIAMTQSYSLSYEFFLSSSTKVIGSQMTAFPSNTMVNFEISPFSYMEYISLESLENGLNSYKNYFNGRYIFSSNIKEVVPNTVWCSYLKNSILYKDIIQKYRIKDSYLLESVFLYVCQHISELVSVNTIVKHFKDKGVRSSYETVASYLLYLEEAYLIHRADRYQVKSRELISGSSKYYINSWSLIAHVYPFINYSDDVKLRNEVFLGLIRREYKVYVGVSKSKIIDFVAQKNDRIIYFQCISSIFDQGLLHSIYSSLQSIQDHYEKWIISLDNEVQPSKDGIRHVQAWNLDSLL